MFSRKIHFIGIGGIGVSALARWFLARKWSVTGSDMGSGAVVESLKKEGVKVFKGHRRENLEKGTGLVVKSQAIGPDNPEVLAAAETGIRTFSYPQVVGSLTRHYRTIAIAGAHGKSTTTSMAAIILKNAGLSPTVIVGTYLKEFGNKNFLDGTMDGWLVLEADEYGRAFWNYNPEIAVVVNIDREHLDIFKTLSGVKVAFLRFLSNTRPGGIFILNLEDRVLRSLASKIEKIAKDRGIKVVWYTTAGNTAKRLKPIMKIPGRHNLSDAVAAYKVGRMLDIPHREIIASIGSYKGSWRRMEYRGVFEKALVYDDYAHHPTEIVATLQGFREKFPEKRILCVFQPHQAKRLAQLFNDFKGAFMEADETLILPAYAVAGRDEAHSKLNAESLARLIQKRNPQKPLFYLPEPDNLKKAILKLGPPKDKVIVMMGAGDIVNRTKTLVKKG